MKQTTQITTTLILGLLLAPPLAANAEDTQNSAAENEAASAWGSSRMVLVEKGKKKNRGIALFTTSDQAPGIAFRCHRKKVYAFVSVKPVSFQKLLREWFRNPAEWQVEYRIDDQEARVETWIWTYKGRVFLSRPGSSTNDLFRAARRGATLKFQRKHGDLVTIEIPAGEPDRFDSFVEKCGLKLTDLGSIQT